MKKFFVACFATALLPLFAAQATAQPDAPAAEDLQGELDAVRDGLFLAFNEGRYEDMLTDFCHPDVIVMWQDGTAGQGHAEVLAEFEKLSKFIDKMEVHPTTEQRLILNDGQLVISSGKMNDKYVLRRGADVELKSSWTTTLVKEDGQWRLVSFSASSNAFDNDVVSLYLRYTKYWSVGIGAAIGLVCGVLGAMVLFRKPRQPAPVV